MLRNILLRLLLGHGGEIAVAVVYVYDLLEGICYQRGIVPGFQVRNDCSKTTLLVSNLADHMHQCVAYPMVFFSLPASNSCNRSLLMVVTNCSRSCLERS